MGFVSSCFELASRNIREAESVVKDIEKQIRELSWWNVYRYIKLNNKLENAKRIYSKAKSDYNNLWR